MVQRPRGLWFPAVVPSHMAAYLIAPLVAGALLAGCQNPADPAGARPAATATHAPLNKDFGDCSRRRCDLGK